MAERFLLPESSRAVRAKLRSRLLATMIAKFFAAGFFLYAANSWAATARDDVTLNFVNVEIEAAVKVMSELSGRNFVIDPRVKGVVSIVSSTPVTRASAYQIFLAALRTQGFAVVETDTSARVMPLADAAFNAPPTVDPSRPGTIAGQRIVTQVFQLKNESAAHLVPVLRPLVSPSTPITALNGSNTLIITDFADNLRRLQRIIESVDQTSDGEPIVVPLRFASAADLAHTLARLNPDAGAAGVAGPGDAGRRVTVVPDLRTNALIIRGDHAARVERMKKLIDNLDQPIAGGGLHVVYLKNADATRVADTLRAMYGTQAAATLAAPPASAQRPATSGATPQSTTSEAVTIHADPANNAVVIRAPEPIYNQLRAVIEKLDTRRAQIFVEALIVEVSSDNAAEFGIQWQSLSALGNSGRHAVGGTSFGGAGQNILDLAQNPLSAGTGLSIGIVRGAINIPGVGTVTNLNVLARALQRNAKANILSTPNLLTTDNEESKIVIGQNVPFITGQYAQSGAVIGAGVTPTPFQTIERRDIGLTLRLRPQIAQGGNVRMRIYQEISSVQDRTNASGIITNKRSIESVVEVEDGLIVALGGLLEDKFDNTTEQVPGLGSIPVLGHLFKYETQRQVKTNLMVFLRPVILRDTRDADALSIDRYQYLIDQQQRTQPGAQSALPNVEVPRLPELKPRVTNPPSATNPNR
jgi:general secretion pathway protein D